MDTKKATLRYFGSSTVEVCMLSTAVARNHAHSDFYFNTMRIKIRLFLHRLLTFLNPKHDEVTEVETSVEEEITVQHPQPVVARLFNEMEEELLADV